MSCSTVYVAENTTQAHLYRIRLAAEGIASRVLDDEPNLESRPAIWVNRDEYQQARELIAKWDAENARLSQPFQYGLIAILTNVTLLSMVFALFAIVKRSSNELLAPLAVVFVLGNLLYLARYRQRRG